MPPLLLTGPRDSAADLLRHMDNPDLLPWRFEGETRGDSEDDVNDTIGAQDLEEDSKELERWARRCLHNLLRLHSLTQMRPLIAYSLLSYPCTGGCLMCKVLRKRPHLAWGVLPPSACWSALLVLWQTHSGCELPRKLCQEECDCTRGISWLSRPLQDLCRGCAQEHLLVGCGLLVALAPPCLSCRGSVRAEEMGAWLAAWPHRPVSLQL